MREQSLKKTNTSANLQENRTLSKNSETNISKQLFFDSAVQDNRKILAKMNFTQNENILSV